MLVLCHCGCGGWKGGGVWGPASQLLIDSKGFWEVQKIGQHRFWSWVPISRYHGNGWSVWEIFADVMEIVELRTPDPRLDAKIAAMPPTRDLQVYKQNYNFVWQCFANSAGSRNSENGVEPARSFRKTGTMGTLASQAEIGVMGPSNG